MLIQAKFRSYVSSCRNLRQAWLRCGFLAWILVIFEDLDPRVP